MSSSVVQINPNGWVMRMATVRDVIAFSTASTFTPMRPMSPLPSLELSFVFSFASSFALASLPLSHKDGGGIGRMSTGTTRTP